MGNIIIFNLHKRKERNNMPDISKDRKIEIEHTVKKVLLKSGYNPTPKANSLIVDIVRLVKRDNFAVQTSEMDINTTGCLIVNDLQSVMDTNKNRLIVVNKFFKNDNDDEDYLLKKSRFITAHEYGHFILHKEHKQKIYAHRDTDHRTEPQELEADYFARAILMPLDLFNKYIIAIDDLKLTDHNIETENLLSAIFKVTKDKIQKRIKDLQELKGDLIC